MDNRFVVYEESGKNPYLWTRQSAAQLREKLIRKLESAETGEVVFIDLKNIEVFDFSFAAEFFGKTMLSMATTFPDKYIVIENLSEYARENLNAALETTGIMAVERRMNGTLELIGKVHAVDKITFSEICSAENEITSADLADRLDKNLTAINERLNKLASNHVIRRSKSVSPAGREMYEYSKIV